MAEKTFTQDEINRIVASRLGRERDRLTREYEKSLKRCMAAVHLTLYQEMCSLKKELDAETKDTLLSEFTHKAVSRQANSSDQHTAENTRKGGEQQ